jgi:hypothetical protein
MTHRRTVELIQHLLVLQPGNNDQAKQNNLLQVKLGRTWNVHMNISSMISKTLATLYHFGFLVVLGFAFTLLLQPHPTLPHPSALAVFQIGAHVFARLGSSYFHFLSS